MRMVLSILALALHAETASADLTLSITLDFGAMDSVTSQTYFCNNGTEIEVQFVNAGANAISFLPINGEDRIFVNVVSGSGAKFVSGEYVWWIKGDAATLKNTLLDGGMLNCQAQDAPPSE